MFRKDLSSQMKEGSLVLRKKKLVPSERLPAWQRLQFLNVALPSIPFPHPFPYPFYFHDFTSWTSNTCRDIANCSGFTRPPLLPPFPHLSVPHRPRLDLSVRQRPKTSSEAPPNSRLCNQKRLSSPPEHSLWLLTNPTVLRQKSA